MDLGIKKIVDGIKEVYPNLDDGQVIELAKAADKQKSKLF